MKKFVSVTEVEGEGLESFLGENVEIQCARYIYAGKLVGVNTSCVLLENAHIVYETGEFNAPRYADAQRFVGGKRYVMIAMIESFGPAKQI